MTPAASAFDQGHQEFATLSPRLWQPLGQALVDRSAPALGERVLDACCGDGASAVPAARAVGEMGRVDAVDAAGALLGQGRAAVGATLPQLRFVYADVTRWASDDGPYDLVQCGFGVFFLPDMDADSTSLVEQLRQGGRFAVSVWSSVALRDYARCLVGAVEEVLGESLPQPAGLQPSERVDSPERLASWLESLGLEDVRTWEQPHQLPLDPELSWLLVTGTGFRGMLGRFDAAGVGRVRDALIRRIDERELRVLDAGSVVGVGVRP